MTTPSRPAIRALVFALAGLLIGGCATAPRTVQLPYAFPVGTPTAAAAAPTAEIVSVTDSREDRSFDRFMNEQPTEILRKALAAELEAGGAFSRVARQGAPIGGAAVTIDVVLHDLSWAVPNHEGIVKTAFWTSFLTGGLGGLAYGATDTPVFGHAVVALKITERASGRVILAEKLDAVHEEKTAKLKCDSLETRARVMAAALKAVLLKATLATAKARAAASPPPAAG